MNATPHPLLIKAVEAGRAGRHAEVIDACDALQAMGKGSALTLFLRGASCYYLGQIDDALALIRRAVVHYPNPDWMLTLCEFCQLQGRYEEAYDAYEQLLQLQPDGLPQDMHQLYTRALRRTGSAPLPLPRRQRFAAMIDWLDIALQRLPRQGWVAECGCFRGHSTRMIAERIAQHEPGFNGERFAVCDSFEGLGQPVSHDIVPNTHPDAARLRAITIPGNFAAPLEQVQANLSDFPSIHWVKGWIPSSLCALPEEARYRFVNIDVDMYEPTAGALHYFWPKLLVGGIMISDDYNWPGAQAAIDAFKASLPAGSFRFGTNAHHQAWFEKI